MIEDLTDERDGIERSTPRTQPTQHNTNRTPHITVHTNDRKTNKLALIKKASIALNTSAKQIGITITDILGWRLHKDREGCHTMQLKIKWGRMNNTRSNKHMLRRWEWTYSDHNEAGIQPHDTWELDTMLRKNVRLRGQYLK